MEGVEEEVSSEVTAAKTAEIMEEASQETKPTESGEFENIDHSVLQTPMNLGVKNVRQIIVALSSGTTEVKHVLTNECNIIYECKICSNLFRCLANFLAHKRFYCKDNATVEVEILTKQVEKETVVVQMGLDEDSLSNKSSEDEFAGYQEDSTHRRSIYSATNNPVLNNKWSPKKGDPMQTILHLERIPSNPNAVFQTVEKLPPGLEVLATKTKACAVQLQKVDLKNTKVKNSFADREEKLSKRSDCNLKTMECLKCKVRFMNVKTLYYHMLNRHTPNTVRYPCPYCTTTCLQVYGVLRHLMRTHRKSKEHAYRLRDGIHQKGFIRNPSNDTIKPASKNILIASASSNTSKKSSDKRSFFKCSKCHRSFDRKSSQVSHEKFCSKHILKCGKCLKTFTTKASFNEHSKACNRKSMHKCGNCHKTFERKSAYTTHIKNCSKTTRKCPKCNKLVENCVCTNRRIITQPKQIRDQDKTPPKTNSSKPDEIKTPLPRPPQLRVMYKIESTGTTVSAETKHINLMDLPQLQSRKVIPISPRTGTTRSSLGLSALRPRRSTGKKEDKDFVDSQSLKWRSANKLESVGGGISSDSPKNSNLVDAPIPNDILNKITTLMNEKNKTCTRCHRKFSSCSSLRRHVATHIGYNRYKCHKCSFRSFYRSDCRAHIMKFHSEENMKQVDNLILSVHSVAGNSKKPSASGTSSKTSTKSRSLSLLTKSPPVLKPVSPPAFRLDSLASDGSTSIAQDRSLKKSMPDLHRHEPSNSVTKTATTTKPIITTLIKKGAPTLQVNSQPQAPNEDPEEQEPPIKIEPFQDMPVSVEQLDHTYQSSSHFSRNDENFNIKASSLSETTNNGDIENNNQPNSVLWTSAMLEGKEDIPTSVVANSFATLVTRAGTYQKKIAPNETVIVETVITE